MRRRMLTAIVAGCLFTGVALPAAKAEWITPYQPPAGLRDLTNQSHTLQIQIQQLQGQANDTQRQIASLQDQLVNLDARIAGTAQELTAAEKQLQVQQDLLNKRLRAMYEDGTVSYLEVLLSSTSFSDFVDRMYALSRIAMQNRQIFDETRKKRDEVQALKRDLESQKQQQQLALLNLSDTLRKLVAEKHSRENQLGQVQRQLSQQSAPRTVYAMVGPGQASWNGGAAAPSLSARGLTSIPQAAMAYIGNPYVFGGASPQTSFDCSGLVQWVYGQSGIGLPRTAQGQYNATQHIGEGQAQPGDLVFFTQTYDTSDTITHVGIYLGNGRMLSADNAGVGIRSITSGYWRNHLYGFGRVR
ncbi:C40 family peptidase [Kyrpidia sp.]|uniref:C40 family peptidase n=1 Tax=Kyrpidia sp. TaxID=2073077 RepID=UPI002588D152|nr:C40 family peptidase [Kyrpidia sp.]MCL6574919.1 C40 family peptidase [Kyrpidia sp.]